MIPTNELRFVQRVIITGEKDLFDNTPIENTVLILQQKWTDHFGYHEEWRDIPVEEE